MINFFVLLTTKKRITDSTSGMRLYNRQMISFYANYTNFDPEPDTIAYLIKCGAKVDEIKVTMRDRMCGESYLKVSSSVKYMINVCSSILFLQWFRKKERIS